MTTPYLRLQTHRSGPFAARRSGVPGHIHDGGQRMNTTYGTLSSDEFTNPPNPLMFETGAQNGKPLLAANRPAEWWGR